MRNRPRVTVLGSLNMDISVTVPRLPEPGATVLGSAARFTPGEKVANQAVAAARLGAEVRMAACVGDGDFAAAAGRAARGGRRPRRRPRHGGRPDRTGHDLGRPAAEHHHGRPGANHEVGTAEITAATARPADVLVICAEIPVPAIKAALTKTALTALTRRP